MGFYYNENGNLQEYKSYSHVVVCPKCEKPYMQDCEEQVPGFRDRSFDICPYCGAENRSSMSEEFTNSKLTEEQQAEYFSTHKKIQH